MNKLALLLVVFISLSANAGISGISAPNSPAVMKSDFNNGNIVIPGPYFENQFDFNTDREATLTAFHIVVTSEEGQTITYDFPNSEPMHLIPGVTKISDIFILGSLPRSGSYSYSVQASVIGTYLDTKESIDYTLNFKTQ